MIRAALTLAVLFAASAAQAGQDVPAPRAIRQVQPLLAAAPPQGFAQPRWRETPPVMQGWSDDRYVPVVGFGEMSACEARARAGVKAQGDVWDDEGDEGDEFAAFDDDDFASGWEDMR
ncbi:hypothetical protein ASE00_08005 [Sphingomonas sp. Root710]|uniref:hypothetical protein n=1 Tax=Sphingomonas sp. Root710 TaxID=1736594 RepID=UPI0006FD9E46|nr:hypothetical protein [Sphingomonas sp. Root710]KRB86619.1 hypothetical protein ASE00_08005 [Sphingomonas sp. Root710]